MAGISVGSTLPRRPQHQDPSPVGSCRTRGKTVLHVITPPRLPRQFPGWLRGARAKSCYTPRSDAVQQYGNTHQFDSFQGTTRLAGSGINKMTARGVATKRGSGKIVAWENWPKALGVFLGSISTHWLHLPWYWGAALLLIVFAIVDVAEKVVKKLMKRGYCPPPDYKQKRKRSIRTRRNARARRRR